MCDAETGGEKEWQTHSKQEPSAEAREYCQTDHSGDQGETLVSWTTWTFLLLSFCSFFVMVCQIQCKRHNAKQGEKLKNSGKKYLETLSYKHCLLLELMMEMVKDIFPVSELPISVPHRYSKRPVTILRDRLTNILHLYLDCKTQLCLQLLE